MFTRQNSLVTILLLVVCFSASAVTNEEKQKEANVEFISVEELKTKVDRNESLVILDVRGSESYANSATRVKGAVHVNVRKLKYRLGFPPLKDIPKDREAVTYCACQSEESAISAAQILLSSGFKRVRVLKGGWQEWLKAKGPVEQRPRG